MAVSYKSKKRAALLLTSVSAIAGVGMGLTSPFAAAANHAASALPKVLILVGVSTLFADCSFVLCWRLRKHLYRK